MALKVTPTGGTLGGGASVAASEFRVMSAVTVEVPPGVVGFGDALVVNTIHGLASRLAAPVPPSAIWRASATGAADAWTKVATPPVVLEIDCFGTVYKRAGGVAHDAIEVRLVGRNGSGKLERIEGDAGAGIGEAVARKRIRENQRSFCAPRVGSVLTEPLKPVNAKP